ncbi:MAG: serine hydrolase [Rhodobacteraceae bacterium]|nr:serine hydrolase [Paracoccaceae bacterium]
MCRRLRAGRCAGRRACRRRDAAGWAQPVGSPGPWHIGSIAKSFTATLIVQLAAAGSSILTRHCRSFCPGSRRNASRLVGRDPARPALPYRRDAGEPALAAAGAVGRAGPARRAPGGDAAALGAAGGGRPGRFVYSNTGYVLAGTVAEQVTGRSWEALIRTQIAAPLGLDSLGFGPPDGAAVPWGHRRVLGLTWAVSPDATWADNPAIIGPAGTLHLSLADLLAWGRAIWRPAGAGVPTSFPPLIAARCKTPSPGPMRWVGW